MTAFHSNGFSRYGAKKYKPECRACTAELAYSRYHSKIAEVVEEAGRKLSCERCGFDGAFAALEFHHNKGVKNRQVSHMQTATKKRLAAEIALCEILCANCHRIEHSPYKKW